MQSLTGFIPAKTMGWNATFVDFCDLIPLAMRTGLLSTILMTDQDTRFYRFSWNNR